MATTGISVLDPVMKIIATEPLYNNVNQDSEWLDLIEASSEGITEDQTNGGRYIQRGHVFGLPAGVGARAENDNMPEADDPEFGESRIYLRDIYGRLEMTGHTMRRVVKDIGAFLSYGDEAFPLFAKRVANERDRILMGFGFGVKARTSGTLQVSGSGHTVTITDAFGVSGYTDAWLQFLKGERIVFSVNAQGNPLRNAGTTQSAKVANITRNAAAGTSTLYLTGSDAALVAAVASGDYIFPGDAAGHSAQGSSGVNREPQGLLAAVDDGGILATYLNITRANRDEFKATVVNAATNFGGIASEDLLNYTDDEVRLNSGAKPRLLLASVNGNRSYWKSLKQDSFFMTRQGMVGGKDSPLSVMLNGRNVQLRVLRKLPPEAMMLVTPETFKLWTHRKYEWQDHTGSIWNRIVTTAGIKDAYYSIGHMSEELTNWAPNQNGRIEGLTKVY